MRPAFAVALTIAALTPGGPAHACRTVAPLHLEDVRFADLVVVGRIARYEIVRDMEFRRKMLASPHLTPDMRKLYEGPEGLISDFARFEVRIDEVLAGSAPAAIIVTWDASTFGEPETMPAGPFLIALRDPKSPMPPLRGPSGYIGPSPDPNLPTVLQAPCSQAFLFESASDEARAVRALLRSGE